jgi:secreted trypsin-like serine protease
MRTYPLSILLAVAVLPGCEVSDIGDTSAPIIGGTETDGDPAVVALVARLPGQERTGLCTATLIAPRVLLTAAHCVSPALLGQGAQHYAFLSHNVIDENSRGQPIDIEAVHYDPLFDHNNPPAGHDIAVAILRERLPIEPIPWLRAPLANAAAYGRRARLVGYGVDNGFMQQGAGRKRTVTVQLNDVDDRFMYVGSLFGGGICQGDSGGPVLVELNGREHVVGVNSFGMLFCLMQSMSTRVDTYADFVTRHVDSPAAQ